MFGGDGAEFAGEQDEIGAEVGGILSVPGGFVFGALGGGDAGAHHVELVLESYLHIGTSSEPAVGCIG